MSESRFGTAGFPGCRKLEPASAVSLHSILTRTAWCHQQHLTSHAASLSDLSLLPVWDIISPIRKTLMRVMRGKRRPSS